MQSHRRIELFDDGVNEQIKTSLVRNKIIIVNCQTVIVGQDSNSHHRLFLANRHAAR
jgi:hypothetical protein